MEKTKQILVKGLEVFSPGTGEEHPDEEKIAMFLEGKGSERERKMMEAHLSGCERCYAVFTGVLEEIKDIEKHGKPFSSSRLYRYAVAASVLLAAFTVWVIISNLPTRQTLINNDNQSAKDIGRSFSITLPCKGDLEGYYFDHSGGSLADRQAIADFTGLLQSAGVDIQEGEVQEITFEADEYVSKELFVEYLLVISLRDGELRVRKKEKR